MKHKISVLTMCVYALLCVLHSVSLAMPGQGSLGLDDDGIAWYAVSYDKGGDGTISAVVQAYYTNNTVKEAKIEELIAEYGVEQEKAETLYYTEYGYEYTEDGKQYAVAYMKHCDSMDDELYGIEYSDKVFNEVSEGSMPAKILAYVQEKFRERKMKAEASHSDGGSGGCNAGAGIFGLFMLSGVFAMNRTVKNNFFPFHKNAV